MAYKFSFTIENCTQGMVQFINRTTLMQRANVKVHQEVFGSTVNYTMQFKEAEKRQEFMEMMWQCGIELAESKPTKPVEV